MIKRNLIALFTVFIVSNIYADNGYLSNRYGSTIQTRYGECVHNSSYGQDSEQPSECQNINLE